MKTRNLVTIAHNTGLNSYHLMMFAVDGVRTLSEPKTNSNPIVYFKALVHDENFFQMDKIKVSDFAKFSKKTDLPIKEFYYLPEVALSWDGEANSLPLSIGMSEERLNGIPLINPRFFFESWGEGLYGITLTIDRGILPKNSAQLGIVIIFFSILSVEGDVLENTTEYLKWRFPPDVDKEMLIKGAKRVSVLI